MYNKGMKYRNTSPATIKHYITESPIITHLDATPKVTLDDALSSEFPVYTKAIGVQHIYDKGVNYIWDAVENGDAKHGGNYVKFTNPAYIYNVLQNTITKFNPGMTIQV